MLVTWVNTAYHTCSSSMSESTHTANLRVILHMHAVCVGLDGTSHLQDRLCGLSLRGLCINFSCTEEMYMAFSVTLWCIMQVKMVYDIFADSGVLEFFKIEERKIMAFIAAVCSHYHRNPYHNFCHVVYVLHTTYMVMMRSQVAKSLTRVDQLVLLIAALCHDVDHDGKLSKPFMNHVHSCDLI